jgi:hypothetical protein
MIGPSSAQQQAPPAHSQLPSQQPSFIRISSSPPSELVAWLAHRQEAEAQAEASVHRRAQAPGSGGPSKIGLVAGYQQHSREIHGD